MIRRAAAALIALLAAFPGATADPPAAALDALIKQAGFEGVALAGDADRPAYVRAPGFSSRGVRNRADAIWRWASVTKQLTATIVMQEVAAGRLALDQPVTAYWPEWPQVFSDRITIRNLLQHTSGLADPNQDGPNLPGGLPAFYRPAPKQGTMAYEATHYCAEHPRAKPGVAFHYDNCDFIVLGALLERITGKSYPALVQERVAGPLGLTLSVFQPGRSAAAHVGGVDEKGRPEVVGDLGTYGASGSIYGSPMSLYAFDRALLAHRLLDPQATATMWAGDPKLGAAALGQWQFIAPLRGCAAPVSIVERRGEIGGVQIRNYILPESGRALVLFTNRGGFDYGEVWQGKGFGFDALSLVGCTG